MHELGTVLYVIEQVEKVVEENNLSEVGSVTVQIGEVSGIIPEYITDAWNWAVKESKYLKKAELKVEKLEAVTFCEDCQKTYPTVKYAKICPYCGSEHTYLVTGNEYNIKEIEAC
jgi:hydrogenase nickel incorporation protein HypA/HybF